MSPSTSSEDAVAVLEKISGSGPVIAVDLDDVLSQTTQCVADWHNRTFSTDMNLSTFYYSMWYKNPGWGTVPETLEKVKQFYATDQLKDALPISGAREGLAALKGLGFELVIVTARIMDGELDSTIRWLRQHFHAIFRYVVFSTQPRDVIHEHDALCIGTSLTKLEICAAIRAVVLIDDLMETALKVGRQGNIPVLLFGDYEWNKRVDAGDQWGFHEKLDEEGGREWWVDDTVVLQDADKIWRTRDWNEVVTWVREAKQAGRL
ncbi:hypothetical protein FA95DRAFT_1507827 [Auriscalpium vulgare]|uniref:Uncharacterized protein n=1 Tax=Auriscalpium vulgare TaxID=40419 RepID=A0ACB8SCD8_9AGAM|nr:hypothetical protein FA95DRAFT_1507827 [Auriscalpium vulgare]